MAVRNIIKIDQEKCNGCGHCVSACSEGAIQMINGKAQLVSETYCDGLGDCIGSCPVDAITIEKRQAPDFDEKAAMAHIAKLEAEKKQPTEKPFMCPSMIAKSLSPCTENKKQINGSSQLSHWPVQLKLLSPNAPFFKNSDFALVADCVAFAMGDFHDKLLKGKTVAIACPKLDDVNGYVEKIAEIIKVNNLKSFTIVRMEVPCCGGLNRIVSSAVAASGVDLKVNEIVISIKGEIM